MHREGARRGGPSRNGEGIRGWRWTSTIGLVRCQECGAEPSADQTCGGRFSDLLLAESEDAGLARMHGLTVLTYHMQHPALTKPWWQIEARALLRCLITEGEPYDQVFVRYRGEASRIRGGQVADRKTRAGSAMPEWVRFGEIRSELTVADLDPALRGGWEVRVNRWARSVASLRFDING